MRIGRWLIYLAIILTALWFFGPREPVDLDVNLDTQLLDGDLDDYLTSQESRYSDLTPGVKKRILWAGKTGEQTALSIIYIHGYSATSEEIRPVPDRLAAEFGANLYFTRLKGHGRPGDAMAEPAVSDWMTDMVEAIEIGRRIGTKTIIISTSTGGSLAAVAAVEPDLMQDVAGLVFIAPNFAVADPMSAILTFPFARKFIPILAGEQRSWEARNPGHATYWTTSYPTVALLPMMALVKHVRGLDFSLAISPALFMYSPDDQVVSARATEKVIAAWGGQTSTELRVMGKGDDPNNHVIAGDIMSPGQTDETVELISKWIQTMAQHP